MAQIKEEDRKELRILIEELSSITEVLRSLRKQVMIRLVMLYCYETIWSFLVCISTHFQLIDVYPVYFIVVNIVFFIVLAFYSYLLMQEPIKRFNRTYQIGLNKLTELVNFVDWKVFRKRQLYNDTNPKVEASVSAFLSISRTMITPNNPKNKLLKLFVLISIIFRYVLLVLSLYIVYVNVWQV